MTRTLSNPLDYPFTIPRHGFVVHGGQVDGGSIPVLDAGRGDVPAAIAANIHRTPDMTGLVGFLTCGSNASPERLAEKLRTCPVPSAIALRIRMANWVPVYAATLSYYGSIPATFTYAPHAVAEPFLVVTDAANMNAMVASEQRTDNYDCYDVGPDTTGLPTAFPVHAFVCRFGALRWNSALLRLGEFQPDERDGVTQAETVERVLAALTPGTALRDFSVRVRDAAFLAELRAKIRDAFASSPHVPGWTIWHGR